ncbi:metallophosphoesterase family protein [Sphingomonas sp. TDK1]|uniref:metallophosphoesterase family protein n=1 Tax=Sphingomonas sp. TDK1 TaxID=453247 RepID=UPI0007D9CD44|nr:metallophosphoesterase family protein [Sphingomonas sp. TDK1]OAN66615.1 metallophosphoesterase [Sphingomonas sp. TDK1]
MLRSLFRRADPQAHALPSGTRAYAIGDVHGRRDLLAELLARIDAERLADPRPNEHLVLLGDLIDRGPDSRGVLDLLLERQAADPTLTILGGNHESMLVAMLDGNLRDLESWLHFGGEECAASYGLDPITLLADPAAASALLRAAIPHAHAALLRALPDSLRLGDVLFVHAGIRPGVALEQQDPQDLRWIRTPFLRSTADHGVLVVHGHTVVSEPEVHPNRIAIDTGASATGCLTALCLDGAERRFLATGA